MHELSLALEICRIAEQQAGTEATACIITVGVEVGDDAGVEPANLEFCLEALLAQPPFQGAHAAITHAPGDVLRVSYLEIEDGSPDD